jgi:tripartite-type tricarboxylate transporter receptor subunit TctC
VVLGSPAATIPYVENGRLRALAVTTAKRIPALPDVPTVAEAGVPGYDVIAWHGIVGPKGLPSPIVAKLNSEMNAALKSKDLVDLLATDGLVPAGGTPEQLLTLIKADIERWRVVVKKGNIKGE